jgi:hypothetical protein
MCRASDDPWLPASVPLAAPAADEDVVVVAPDAGVVGLVAEAPCDVDRPVPAGELVGVTAVPAAVLTVVGVTEGPGVALTTVVVVGAGPAGV